MLLTRSPCGHLACSKLQVSRCNVQISLSVMPAAVIVAPDAVLSGVAWLQVSMQTLNILQSHYPERLGMAVCYHAPRLFSFSFKVHPAKVSLTVPRLDVTVCWRGSPLSWAAVLRWRCAGCSCCLRAL